MSLERLANNKLNRSKSSRKIWIAIGITLLILVILTIIVQIRDSVEDPAIFTLQFTNICFAVFLGLGNVIFSWSRSLEKTEYQDVMPSLNRVGTACLCCSIALIFTSLFTFILFDGVLANEGDDHFFVKLMICSRIITIVFSLFLMVLILRKIILVVWRVIVVDKFKQL